MKMDKNKIAGVSIVVAIGVLLWLLKSMNSKTVVEANPFDTLAAVPYKGDPLSPNPQFVMVPPTIPPNTINISGMNLPQAPPSYEISDLANTRAVKMPTLAKKSTAGDGGGDCGCGCGGACQTCESSCPSNTGFPDGSGCMARNMNQLLAANNIAPAPYVQPFTLYARAPR